MAFDPSNDYGPYEDVTTGANGTIPNGLPLTTTASGFRYRKDVFVHIDLFHFQDNLGFVLDGDFLNRVRETREPDARILFEQRVRLRIQVVAISDPFFGSIGFVTWFPLDEGAGIIETTIVNGEPVDPALAWQQVDVAVPTEFSEQLGYTIFDPEAAITLGGFDFFATWYSAPYKVDVAPGAVLERVYDHWGVGTILDEATFGFSFKDGVPHLDGLMDPAGGFRMARVAAGGVRMVHTYDGLGGLETRARLAGLREPSIWKDATNRIRLAALDGNTYKLFESRDDGRTFRAEQLKQADNTMADVTIFDASFKLPRARNLKSGGAIAWALKGGYLWTKRSPDGLDWTDATWRAQPYKREEPYVVVEDLRNGALQLSNAKDHVLVSRDGGMSWSEEA